MRVVSLFLPTWPTDRLRRQMGDAALPPERALVIAGRDGQRRIVAAADYAAQVLGVRPGLALSQAQARIPDLISQLDDRGGPEAAVEVVVQEHLRGSSDDLGREHGPSSHAARPAGEGSAARG